MSSSTAGAAIAFPAMVKISAATQTKRAFLIFAPSSAWKGRISLRRGWSEYATSSKTPPGVWTLAAMFLGLVVVFTCGAAFLDLFYLHNVKESIVSGFLIFTWWDMLKLSAAAAIYNEVAKRYKKLPV